MTLKTAWTILAVGVALNLIDLVTDGKVFGAAGFLKGVNDQLPKAKVPGTEIPVNLGGWIALTGAGLVLYKKFA